MNMRKRTLKIKEVKEVAFMNEKAYLYALAEDGNIYFIHHDPENNIAEWQKMPSPI
jgi:hypothetical protein